MEILWWGREASSGEETISQARVCFLFPHMEVMEKSGRNGERKERKKKEAINDFIFEK